MITAILAGAILFCLFCGKLPTLPLGVLSVAGALLLCRLHRHEHGGVLVIDQLAQRSRLGGIHAGFKMAVCTALLLLCVGAQAAWVGVAAAMVFSWATVVCGGVPLHHYLSLISLPASFLIISGLALLFGYSGQPQGVLDIPLFGGYMSVTAASQADTALVISRAFGGLCCAYLLTLSTPMSSLIAVLRSLHLPSVVVDLMVLVYRYIFILLDMHSQMRAAAASRLGLSNLRQSIRTTGVIYSRLLLRSFLRASSCFDAMESRCYEGDIRFLPQRQRLRAGEAAVGVISVFVLLTAVWLSGKGVA